MGQTQTRVLTIISAGGVFLFAFAFGFFVSSDRAYAGNEECIGTWDVMCPCGKNMNPKTKQCDLPMGNKKDCTCSDNTNGFSTTGKCSSPGQCKAEQSSGQGVDSGLSQLGQMLSKAMDALKGGGGGGGSGSGGGGQQPGAQPGQTPGAGSCTSYYQVSTPSSDPCAYYVPPTGSDVAGGILDTLSGNTPVSALPLLSPTGGGAVQAPTGALAPTSATNPTSGAWGTGAGLGGLVDTVKTGPVQSTGGTAPASQTSVNGSTGLATAPAAVLLNDPNAINLRANTDNIATGGSTFDEGTDSIDNGGVSGGRANLGKSFFATPDAAAPTSKDAFTSFSTVTSLDASSSRSLSGGTTQIGPGGATISASDGGDTNVVSSGFFGSDTFGGAQSPGVLGWLCQSRPWAKSLVSKIIPDSFFDNACTARGYQVGPPPASPTTAPVLTQTPARKNMPATTTIQASTSTKPTVPPQVQIWAVPASVPIGSRTSVFWSARGVESCIVTSPDGSFNQTSLSGGASTVPLTTATTYSISCLTADNMPATAYFTVRMSI